MRPYVNGNADGNALGGGIHSVSRKVSAASYCLDLIMAEELPDHGLAFTEGMSPRSDGEGRAGAESAELGLIAGRDERHMCVEWRIQFEGPWFASEVP